MQRMYDGPAAPLANPRLTSHHRSRLGVTLVELLVSIGIIGLLAALIMPAVHSSRESARRTECLSHIKQLILACHEHEATHGFFPMPFAERESWTVRILPYLDQSKPPAPVNGVSRGEKQIVSVFQCPSDPEATGEVNSSFGQSYFPNDGYGLFARNGFYQSESGIPMQVKHMTDGQSVTMAFSERRASLSPTLHQDYSSPVWIGRDIRKTSAFIADMDAFADECEQRSSPPLTILTNTLCFNSIQTPNRRSCGNGPPGTLQALEHGAFTATSMHTGGVNVAMVDGSSRMISDRIDRSVWRAISTRAGSETVGDF